MMKRKNLRMLPKHFILLSIFLLWSVSITTIQATDTFRLITSKNVVKLIKKSMPKDVGRTKEIAYFYRLPKKGDKPIIKTKKQLKELGKAIAERIYRKDFGVDSGYYLFQSNAFVSLKDRKPVWHVYNRDEYKKQAQEDNRASKYKPDIEILDPNSSEHFALVFINEKVGYGVIALKDLKPGTLIGPFTGLFTQNLPPDVNKSTYNWNKAYDDHAINGSVTGSLLAFVNHPYENEKNGNKPGKEIHIDRDSEDLKYEDLQGKNSTANLKWVTQKVEITVYKTQKKDIEKIEANISFYQVTKLINKHEQLLIDYGGKYWKNKKRVLSDPNETYENSADSDLGYPNKHFEPNKCCIIQ